MEVKKEEKKNREKIETLLEDISSLETYIADLFTFAPLPICFISPSGIVLEFNPAFSQLSGYDGYEIIGEGIELIMEKEDLEEIIKSTIDKERVRGKELSLTTKEGGKVAVSVFTTTRKDKQKNIVGIFIGAFDITEIKEAETKLKEKVEDLDKFQAILVGRELKMVELKEEINNLKEKLKNKNQED